MKTTLTYEFKDNEDDGRLYMIQNAENLYWVLWEFDQELRDIVKHGRAEPLGMDEETIDQIRGILCDFMDKHNVDFDQVE